jgi:hypothetical protein
MSRVMKEEFKYLEEFNNRFSIGNQGTVINNLKNKIVKPHINRSYYRVTTTVNKKIVSKPIHRLVAKYFVLNENPENFNFVHHIDNNPLNNHYTNLQWCTNSFNVKEMLERRHFQNKEVVKHKKDIRECLKCKTIKKINNCISKIGVV